MSNGSSEQGGFFLVKFPEQVSNYNGQEDPQQDQHGAPSEPMGFDESFEAAVAARAELMDKHGALVSAAEADVRKGVSGMFERVLRRQRTAERDELGMGTPVDELPLDDETREGLVKFFQKMESGNPKTKTWDFYTVHDTTPEPPAAPERPVEPSMVGLSWLSRKRVKDEYAAALEKYEAALRKPVAKLMPTSERQELKRVEGWPLGYATREPLEVTEGGRPVWTSMQSTPEEVVLGIDGAVYCIPSGISLDRFVSVTKDTLPKGLPLDEEGFSVMPEFGKFGPVRRTTVEYGGQEITVLYSEFEPSGHKLLKRLVDIAVANYRPAPEKPAVEEKAAEEETRAEEKLPVERADVEEIEAAPESELVEAK